MEKEEISKIKKAGEIHRKVMAYAREIVKPGVKLLEIADKIDAKIAELGGKAAFPVNLSVNEVAAHSTPTWNDEAVARGLLKVDVGVHVDGWVADGAFSVDLDDSEENRKLIESAEAGLKGALEFVNKGVTLGEIGNSISSGIKEIGESAGLSLVPIVNLSGHEIKKYELHAGMNIPNYDNGQEVAIEEGLFAIEPFATNGHGKVRDGKPSGIFRLAGSGNVRDGFAREVLGYIANEYDELPFCSRWIFKKFGGRGLLALRQIEQAGLLHQYAQLVEVGKGKVAQAEHTVLLVGDEKIVTTK
jgi:methionyl aminopeptidase